MKKIITLAIAAIALIGLPAVAQEQANTTCTKEGCEKAVPEKGPRFNGKKGQRPDVFEGITLTEAQQKAIADLKAQRMEKYKQKRDAAKADRRQNDSTAMATRKASQREYLNNMKGILTPDQYVIFLENIVLEQPAGPNAFKGKGMRPEGPRKDQREGMRDGRRMERRTGDGFAKGQRPQRGQNMQAPAAQE